MPRVPFLGRLSIREYTALILSLLFVIVEALVRYPTLLLPKPVLNWFHDRSRELFHAFVPPSRRLSSRSKSREGREGEDERKTAERIRMTGSFEGLCKIWGYEAETHIVQTKDGYLLGLHRLPFKRSEPRTSASPISPSHAPSKKPIVYLHHGLLMNSEVWVCVTDPSRCIPFILVELGYDVWLGNNRGNKYSKKAIHATPNTTRFWDFSMDEMCMHDIPDSIAYILSTTGRDTIDAYIGFSQGSAQGFAALSVHPSLNRKISRMIALAPALSPPGLAQPIVDSLMKASPTLVFLFFGRKAILGSAVMWQSILYNPIFNAVIDGGLKFLFNWRGANIDALQKVAAYSHLYSFTSVKAVVHWFQIMRRGSFQMYDDDISSALYSKSFYSPAPFPTKNIVTPITLIYGSSDSLVDIDVMLAQLPGHGRTSVVRVEGHEHVDIIWGRDVATKVIPEVVKAVKRDIKSVGEDNGVSNGGDDMDRTTTMSRTDSD
ncbi:alpha/beta-hydrolase [Sistotremastrum niveocremeum HHB9708]|uniref:Alpha/beta-hydrolase n=2 Tax=Sistotremastraceae TaxID=3402574 RepID=A0A164PN23_9AGAM|nr:alpha/beta-hydrolase [Sistotremastrum niveocremeum HHB9708]KZT34446.1 alpha/beta-hydrolase [Sistotremastrum suecicum HHB10207 ss-3]